MKQYKEYYKHSYKNFTDREINKISSNRILKYINLKNLKRKGELGREKQLDMLSNTEKLQLGIKDKMNRSNEFKPT